MAFNQISNQTQAMASPPSPLITDSNMMNSHVNHQGQQPLIPYAQMMNSQVNHQEPYHANLLPDLSQLSFELNNRRENMQAYLQLQNLETINSIVNEHKNQDILVHNYASHLLDLIHELENEVAAKNHANLELRKKIGEYDSQLKWFATKASEKDAIVASLNQQIEMVQKRHHELMIAFEPYAGPSSGGLSKDIIDSDCQMCRKELSSVVIFPCKHLCCCKACEANVYSCPVCEIAKESSVEVSWPLMKKGANLDEIK